MRELIEMAKNELMKQLPDAAKIGLSLEDTNVVKMNDQQLHGLSFRKSDVNIAPTVYLDQAFERYREGEAIADLMKEVADIYLHANGERIAPPEPKLDFESMKDQLTLRLVEILYTTNLLLQPHSGRKELL